MSKNVSQGSFEDADQLLAGVDDLLEGLKK
jgi:hypothetical protein